MNPIVLIPNRIVTKCEANASCAYPVMFYYRKYKEQDFGLKFAPIEEKYLCEVHTRIAIP